MPPSRVDQLGSKDSPLAKELPNRTAGLWRECFICHNEGYIGAPEAVLAHGTLMAVAFEKGESCACKEAGAEFAAWQLLWIQGEKPPAVSA